jgi:hypothetical protein
MMETTLRNRLDLMKGVGRHWLWMGLLVALTATVEATSPTIIAEGDKAAAPQKKVGRIHEIERRGPARLSATSRPTSGGRVERYRRNPSESSIDADDQHRRRHDPRLRHGQVTGRQSSYYGWSDRHLGYRGLPPIIIANYGEERGPSHWPQASYEIVERRAQSLAWIRGHEEEVPLVDVIDGEFVDVYHPAVYRRGESDELVEVEAERTTREPKVRIILTTVWVEGHYATAPAQSDPPGPEVPAMP